MTGIRAERIEVGPDGCDGLTRNLAGQRLGRKGQETRERIVRAALRLLEDPEGPAVTLTSVAREAEMRLTNLYLYFPDFVELLLAALRRVADEAGEQVGEQIRLPWPDDRLADYCLGFARGHYEFWKRNSRILHLRNTLSETDPRMMADRHKASRPVLTILLLQMTKGDENDADQDTINMATVVLTGLERIATVTTNPHSRLMSFGRSDMSQADLIDGLITAEARLLELAIRDRRTVLRHSINEGPYD